MEVPKIRRRTLPTPRAPRRVATAPSALQSSFSEKSSTSSSVETLYTHPNAKIVAFTASGRSEVHGGGDVFSSTDDEEPGTLSWSSQLESTIAVGAFRIYRAPGSVAFLSSGHVLQPILPKSQCWCIDEEHSRFVLQIRRPNYWRIELPIATVEDRERTLPFVGILDQVLQFEKTACPFKRSFSVELPEMPQGPIIRKPWKPVPRLSSDYLPGPVTPPEQQRVGRSHDKTTLHGSVRNHTPGRQKNSALPTNYEHEAYGQANDWTVLSAPDVGSLQAGVNVAEQAQCINLRTAATDPIVDVKVHFSCENLNSSTTQEENHKALPDPKAVDRGCVEVRAASTELGDALDATLDPKNASTGSESIACSARSRSHENLVPEGTHEPVNGATLRQEACAGSSRRSLGLGPSNPIVASSSPSEAADELCTAIAHTSLSRGGSSAGSQESFYSMQSWHSAGTPLPPLPPTSYSEVPGAFPFPHENIALPDRNVPAVNTTTAASNAFKKESSWEIGSNDETGSSHGTATTAADSTTFKPRFIPGSHLLETKAAASTALDTVKVHSRRQDQCEPTRDRRREPSPLPPASTLFTPTARCERGPNWSGLSLVKRLPLTVVVKTCELLLGPPAHLLVLMLKVAARISAGEWKGWAYGYGEDGDQIPVHWDYSEGDFSDWSHDDELHDSVAHNETARRCSREERR